MKLLLGQASTQTDAQTNAQTHNQESDGYGLCRAHRLLDRQKKQMFKSRNFGIYRVKM